MWAAISGSSRNNVTRGSARRIGYYESRGSADPRLATQSAQYILGPFGRDSALRRWGCLWRAMVGRMRKNAPWSRWRANSWY